ncbi:hypothetical protein HMPREF3213_00264 [Heyndrickxia coagulans]|uniref:Uncharacterized protein n=1 Tax=Heyndrickxia coagulans TaxID=1398 RepID=A0A133L1N3_HEYCO|nr:hypothetical protein HMPREF3213_00264 [Heyndrickxia coagulans]
MSRASFLNSLLLKPSWGKLPAYLSIKSILNYLIFFLLPMR